MADPALLPSVWVIQRQGLTFQALTEPRGNLHTLTFSPEPYCSPVLTSSGTPWRESSFVRPGILQQRPLQLRDTAVCQ